MPFNIAFHRIIEVEGRIGKIDNDPADTGGTTNAGITYKVYSQRCGRLYGVLPSMTHFKKLTEKEVFIFYHDIWEKYELDTLPENMAYLIFDFVVNSGQAVMLIQKYLNENGEKITIDGNWGKNTILAMQNVISRVGERAVYSEIILVRIAYVNSLVAKDIKAYPHETTKNFKKNRVKFLHGWLNRYLKNPYPKNA